jgi:hypothetical protein
LYADDTAIIYSHKDPRVIGKKLSDMLQSCQEWLVDNKLSLHLGKTESIMFGTKRKLTPNIEEQFEVKCVDQVIKRQECVKYLGVQLDKTLSGELIVNSIINKANQRLKFLYRHQKCLSQSARKTLCISLIQCHIDYSCSAWYEGLSKKSKQKLQVIQNKMTRFILGMKNRQSVTFKELKSIGFLDIPNRIKQLRLNHAFSIYYGTAPAYLNENFKVQNSGYNTRSSPLNFEIPHVKGQEKHSFYYQTAKDWNQLPDFIKRFSEKF